MILSEVTAGLEGELLEDGSFMTIDFCTADNDCSFMSFLENPKFLDRIHKNVSCILCRKELVPLLPTWVKGIFVTEEPKYAFYSIHNMMASEKKKDEKEFETVIGSDSFISPTAHIAAKKVKIGNNVLIEDNVVIYEDVEIGDNSIIHSNVVIGGKSFDFAKGSNGKIIGWDDSGSVHIGRNVEILPMVHIAKGCLLTDVTYIQDNVKIDALTYIAHGVHIGERTLVAASVTIGGNVSIGKDAWIGMNATVSNRIKIGDRARVSLGAVVTKDVADESVVSGNFAIDHNRFLRNLKNSICEEE